MSRGLPRDVWTRVQDSHLIPTDELRLCLSPTVVTDSGFVTGSM